MDKNRLLAAFLICAGMMIVEFAAGIISRSVALTSDALHMTVDASALGCSFWAARIVHKNKKAEVYAALVNGVLLIIMSVFLLNSAFHRFVCPVAVQCGLMIGAAVLGFLANIIQFLILRRGNRENINMRSAILHVVSDALSSVGVICGGIVIYFTNWYPVDSILGCVIGLAVFRYGVILTKDSIKILKRGPA